MPVTTETHWLQQAQNQNLTAWETLMQTHQEPVFRLAYLLLGDPDDAEDVTQETFIRAYRALPTFDATRPLRPWLLKICTNLARNHHRSLSRYWTALQRRLANDHPEPPDIETRASQHLQATRLWQAVRRLRSEDQQIIYLRFFLDLPVNETATVANLAEGTVKSRTSRALTRLRHLIEREYPDLHMDLPDES